MIFSCFTACGNTGSDDGVLKVPQEDLSEVEYGSFENFTTIDFDGKKVTEDIFEGKKLTMINIWATFCGPCINEMPDLATLNKEYADKDFQVIGIVCDVGYSNEGYYDSSLYESAVTIAEMTGADYVNLLPSQSLDFIKLREVYSVPETIFVDENGNIIGESYIGSRSYESWKVLIDSVFDSIAE